MGEQLRYKSFLLKAGYWAAIALLALLFFKYLFNPLLPFIIALAVSMILRPLVVRLTAKIKIKNSVTATIIVILAYLLLAALIAGILVGLASAIISWASGLPDYFTENIYPSLDRYGTKLLEFAERFEPEQQEFVVNMLPDIVSTISGFVVDFSKSAVTWASSVGTRLPSAFLTTVICVIATVFISIDYDNVAGTLLHKFPFRVQEALLFGKGAFSKIIINFAKSYSIILLITFAEMFIGLLIIGYENALLYAVAVAVFDILPVVGSGMVLVPWIIITFVQGSIGKGFGLMVLWLIVVTARQFIEPRVVGKQVGIHPLATLVSMWLGLKLVGGVGLLAFPILLLIIIELKEGGFFSQNNEAENALQTSEEQEQS